jgi:hypothetical protein
MSAPAYNRSQAVRPVARSVYCGWLHILPELYDVQFWKKKQKKHYFINLHKFCFIEPFISLPFTSCDGRSSSHQAIHWGNRNGFTFRKVPGMAPPKEGKTFPLQYCQDDMSNGPPHRLTLPSAHILWQNKTNLWMLHHNFSINEGCRNHLLEESILHISYFRVRIASHGYSFVFRVVL